jgi:hypothetical protein
MFLNSINNVITLVDVEDMYFKYSFLLSGDLYWIHDGMDSKSVGGDCMIVLEFILYT